MKIIIYIYSLLFAVNFSYAQNYECSKNDMAPRKIINFVKKDYKEYKQHVCDLIKYSDNKDAKELLCKANYFFSIRDFYSSEAYLKQAYLKGFSAEFKFQILKLMVNNYKHLGEEKLAENYQNKVNRVLEKFPDIDK